MVTVLYRTLKPGTSAASPSPSREQQPLALASSAALSVSFGGGPGRRERRDDCRIDLHHLRPRRIRPSVAGSGGGFRRRVLWTWLSQVAARPSSASDSDSAERDGVEAEIGVSERMEEPRNVGECGPGATHLHRHLDQHTFGHLIGPRPAPPSLMLVDLPSTNGSPRRQASTNPSGLARTQSRSGWVNVAVDLTTRFPTRLTQERMTGQGCCPTAASPASDTGTLPVFFRPEAKCVLPTG